MNDFKSLDSRLEWEISVEEKKLSSGGTNTWIVLVALATLVWLAFSTFPNVTSPIHAVCLAGAYTYFSAKLTYQFFRNSQEVGGTKETRFLRDWGSFPRVLLFGVVGATGIYLVAQEAWVPLQRIVGSLPFVFLLFVSTAGFAFQASNFPMPDVPKTDYMKIHRVVDYAANGTVLVLVSIAIRNLVAIYENEFVFPQIEAAKLSLLIAVILFLVDWSNIFEKKASKLDALIGLKRSVLANELSEKDCLERLENVLNGETVGQIFSKDAKEIEYYLSVAEIFVHKSRGILATLKEGAATYDGTVQFGESLTILGDALAHNLAETARCVVRSENELKRRKGKISLLYWASNSSRLFLSPVIGGFQSRQNAVVRDLWGIYEGYAEIFKDKKFAAVGFSVPDLGQHFERRLK